MFYQKKKKQCQAYVPKKKKFFFRPETNFDKNKKMCDMSRK